MSRLKTDISSMYRFVLFPTLIFLWAGGGYSRHAFVSKLLRKSNTECSLVHRASVATALSSEISRKIVKGGWKGCERGRVL